jgi:hypothetical protein
MNFDLGRFASKRARKRDKDGAEHVYSPGLGRYVRIISETKPEAAVQHKWEKQKKPFKAKFVQVPRRWLKALQRSRSASTYQLALKILLKRFESGDDEVKLSSAMAEMPRSTRRRAAQELVKLGLIKVRHGGKEALKATPK